MSSLIRSTRLASRQIPAVTRINAQPQRMLTTYAVSKPTLANIEKRWEEMPPQEQADVWMQLRDRMKDNWSELSLQEKKAAYWIAFGNHGPRAEAPPGEGWKVLRYTVYGVIASAVLFGSTRLGAGPPPATMTKEYQQMSNEYLQEHNAEPIGGIDMVQSK